MKGGPNKKKNHKKIKKKKKKKNLGVLWCIDIDFMDDKE